MNIKPSTIFTGDNLPIMRGINSDSVDLIYLDPPFNSNANYAAPIGSEAAGAEFKDTWGLSDIDLAWHGELADKHQGMHDFLLSVQQVHSKSMFAYLIYMAIRLQEIHRILKPTGSVYLHCDPTASHYLKLLMDDIFGKANFRDEIIWKRQTAKKGSQYKKASFGTSSDTLFFYTKSSAHNFNIPKVQLSEAAMNKKFSRIDENGRRFRTDRITLPSGMARDNLIYEYKGYTPKYGWMMNKDKLEAMDSENRIYWTASGKAYRKYFQAEYGGQEVGNIWTDITVAAGKERTGYRTQKPLKLLDRIIKASSNEGDSVLDPFCGCATACLSAQRHGRQWVGIDISPKAFKLINIRLKKELGGIFAKPIQRTDIPERTDIGKLPRYNDKENKNFLYGEQQGNCGGCGMHFSYRNLTTDHKTPRDKGGTDHISNLQLLCGACNSTKGVGTQAELLAKLKRQKVIL